MFLPRAGALALLLIAACSNSKPKPADDASGDSQDDGAIDPQPPPDSGPVVTRKGDGDGPTEDTPPARKQTHELPDDYEMTANDCDVLAAQYRVAWLNTERKKQEKALSDPKLGAQAQANLERAADQGRDSWYKACYGIVGAPFLRSRLVCAAKAKTMERFDDCWDGKAGEEQER